MCTVLVYTQNQTQTHQDEIYLAAGSARNESNAIQSVFTMRLFKSGHRH